MTDAGRLDRLAELVVGLGANVQPGQVVSVSADLGEEELARAVAAAAYRRGARFVDVRYFDAWVKRERILHARDDETLSFVPPWYAERIRTLGELGAATIALASAHAPDALAGLDPRRASRDLLPAVPESLEVTAKRLVNWTVVPAPTLQWARLVHPELADEQAYETLWREIEHVCRLDEPDPVAAWQARVAELERVMAVLDELDLAAVRFEGPGTDLTVPLLPGSRWAGPIDTRADGLRFMGNVPTEEVFSVPDPGRVEGVVRSTRPLVLLDGTQVHGLEVEFREGRAVRIDADEGAEVLRGRASVDDGAGRLGEVALVDCESRIGQLGTVFYTTLLDENAVSHVALGDAIVECLVDDGDPARNRSAIHVDFMIGGPEVDATGSGRNGGRVPLLRGGRWQI